MDRHNMTSYPLKLPFIRSSKIARKECIFENERCLTEFENYRCGSQGSAVPQYSNAEKFALKSKLSIAPIKKSPIEIQLDNFRKKAIQMGFATEDSQPLTNFQQILTNDGEDYSSNRNFIWPQSQPVTSTCVPPDDPPLMWSQQVSQRDYYCQGGFRNLAETQLYNSYPTQHQANANIQWLERNNFQFSEPVEKYLTTNSFQRSRFNANFNLRANSANHDDSFMDDVSRHMPQFQSQPRSLSMGPAPIHCGAFSQDGATPDPPRYCRWYEGSSSSVNKSPETSLQHWFSWNKNGAWNRSDDDFGSLRGLTSHSGRRKTEQLQPRKSDYGRNLLSPALSTTKSHRCQSVYGIDSDADNDEWDETFATQSQYRQPSQQIILDLSPIDKSSPRKTERRGCQCCRKRAFANRGSQTCSPAAYVKRPSLLNVQVQTDNAHRSQDFVDKECQTSPDQEDERTRFDETDPQLFDTHEHLNGSEEAGREQCTSFVTSLPDGEFLDDFLIGVQREP